MFRLAQTAAFERRLQRFLQRHPDLRSRIAQVMRDLSHDPFSTHLHLHSLTGRMSGLHAVRLTYSYRLIVRIDSEARRIALIDIGSHDEVYG